ncbi:MAG: hypothetical protein HY580_04330 [Nitrospinae bacterium]|nr:hypothetical protein [Nitrospinota bacterium]
MEIQMVKDRQFDFKKAQIENFIRAEFKKKFGGNARISVRKRQKFMEATTKKIAERFGKDVLCLVDFTRHGFVSLVSPSHTESTDKGRLFRSFSHPQVYYTSHCLERFSQRTETMENCIISLDAYLSDAMMTYGMFDGYLVCRDGVFAYELEDERLIIKTYINHELLTDKQIEKFYGPETFLCFADDAITGDSGESDFILLDELPLPPGK